ncbi:hypothetical protein XENOCAPTIV_029275 [Xenoophorus captivus]|uniref:RING-type domain-containing protein n=1 Tax=Xenoophorus captivus TaxID=1517983 RepID=A0ABV0RCD1_9TELE
MTVFFPLDTARLRLQVDENRKAKSTPAILADIFGQFNTPKEKSKLLSSLKTIKGLLVNRARTPPRLNYQISSINCYKTDITFRPISRKYSKQWQKIVFFINMDPTTAKESEKTCVLCCQDIDIFALGKCDHPVCYRCSTKMRVLCDQKYCAVCREELDKVRIPLLL